MRAGDQSLRAVRASLFGPWMRRQAGLTAAGVLLLTAATLLGRRWSGALHQPLEPMALVLAASLMTALAAAARGLWLSDVAQRQVTRKPVGFNLLVTFAMAGIAGAVSLPGTSPIGLSAMWLLIVGTEVFGWWLSGPSRRSWRRTNRRSEGPAPDHPIGTATRPTPPTPTGVPSPRSDDSVNQYLIRRADAAGGEEVSGWATTQLYAGQRTAMLHVAFCPPFASSPTVDVRQTAGPIARVRAAQVLPWGARIEVKLPQAADSPCQARIEFRASCPPANKSGN